MRGTRGDEIAAAAATVRRNRDRHAAGIAVGANQRCELGAFENRQVAVHDQDVIDAAAREACDSGRNHAIQAAGA